MVEFDVHWVLLESSNHLCPRVDTNRSTVHTLMAFIVDVYVSVGAGLHVRAPVCVDLCTLK